MNTISDGTDADVTAQLNKKQANRYDVKKVHIRLFTAI